MDANQRLPSIHPDPSPQAETYGCGSLPGSRAVNGETIKTDYQVEVCSEELAELGATRSEFR